MKIFFKILYIIFLYIVPFFIMSIASLTIPHPFSASYKDYLSGDKFIFATSFISSIFIGLIFYIAFLLNKK